jgi:CCR4-NOT transcription complex subunit 6
VDKVMTRQDWHNMDMSGQGLRNLAPELFRYHFLNELYIASNKLTRLPNSIGQLRQLRHLDASYNQINELPPELGMCTYLKQLLLFNNNLQELPFELGSLHQLEMLGIEGNPLEPNIKQEIIEKGTKSLINALMEGAPSMSPILIEAHQFAHYFAMIANFISFYSSSTPYSAKRNHHSGGRARGSGKNQSLFLEYSLR